MRPIKGKEAIARLKKLGFCVARIKGSHHIMENTETGRICVVPVHGARDIPVPVIKSVLKQEKRGLIKAIDILQKHLVLAHQLKNLELRTLLLWRKLLRKVRNNDRNF